MAVAALSATNPYFTRRELDWVMMRDAYSGERTIKEKGEDYLAPTAAMVADGLGHNQAGWQAYRAYLSRAVYHELVKPALQAMLGVMHRKEPDIQLPPVLDPMRKAATFNGESLPWLMQKITEQQMLMGRYGLMLDVADGAPVSAMPYIVGYNAEQIINWDTSKVGDKVNSGPSRIKLVVLNETDYQRRSGLSWVQVMKYRVLARAGDVKDIWPGIAAGDDEYVAAELQQTQDATNADFVSPSLGGVTLNHVPFVFIGPRDLVAEPDAPVLLPMARIALAIYRTEADYRQALYMQGQDTLVVIGQQTQVDPNTKVGAFGSIDLPKGGDAKYIGADAGGLDQMANAIQNDFKRAAQLGAQLLTERGNEAESGDALNIRVASRTATLTTVANAAAAGLQSVLRAAAEWKGADPDKVLVQPNLDFVDDAAQAQDLTYLMTAKSMGAPISKKSIHGWLSDREFTKMDFEQEMKEIESEGPDLLMTPAGGAPRGVPGSPNAPVPGAAPKGTKVAAKAAATPPAKPAAK